MAGAEGVGRAGEDFVHLRVGEDDFRAFGLKERGVPAGDAARRLRIHRLDPAAVGVTALQGRVVVLQEHHVADPELPRVELSQKAHAGEKKLFSGRRLRGSVRGGVVVLPLEDDGRTMKDPVAGDAFLGLLPQNAASCA